MERKKLYCGLCLAVVISAAAAVNGAETQETLGRGKTPAQTFASDCAVCHKSPQGLAKSANGLIGVEGFLVEHYTSSRESAAALASYLRSVGTAPGAVRAKRAAKGDQPKADEWKKAGPKPAEAKGADSKPDAAGGGAGPRREAPDIMALGGEQWNRGRHPRMRTDCRGRGDSQSAIARRSNVFHFLLLPSAGLAGGRLASSAATPSSC